MVSKTQKFLLAVVYPLLVQSVGAVMMMAGNSAASGGPFAGILILVLFMGTAPITLIVNSIALLPQDQEKAWYFKRGMILPGIFLTAYFIYFAGIWDMFF
ncbi:MAG: hypothetical protein GKR91_08250 [Pseudomonadales bacterium]|nr:hypothetical protein [Pseudomonadales bacterium]